MKCGVLCAIYGRLRSAIILALLQKHRRIAPPPHPKEETQSQTQESRVSRRQIYYARDSILASR